MMAIAAPELTRDDLNLRHCVEHIAALVNDGYTDEAKAVVQAIERKSGRLVLRLPKGLHEKAAKMAAAEGVSLNQLLLCAIAAYVNGGR